MTKKINALFLKSQPHHCAFSPAYMTMGATGMSDMGTMGMPMPRNSLSMMGGPGPFDYISMGGMFTILKIRESISNYEDPGWYKHPEGTVANLASLEEMGRDLEMASAAPTGAL